MADYKVGYEYAILQKGDGRVPHYTRGLPVPAVRVFFFFWRKLWPRAVWYEEELYGDTGRLEEGFRLYIRNHGIIKYEAHGE